MSEHTWWSEEQVHRSAWIATAREFKIPLWIVEVNEICYAKGVEWFYIYKEADNE